MDDLVPPRFEDVRVRPRSDDTLDADFFNRRFRIIVEFLALLAERANAVGSAEASLISLGLTKINEVLGPSLNKITAAANLGFLVAESDTSATLAVGQAVQLTVLEGDGVRDLFTPTPFLSIVRKAANAGDQFATARLVQYDNSTGALIISPIYVSSALAGAHSDWVIAASGATIEAMASAVAEAQAVRDDLTAAQGQLDAALAAIEGGAVVSVNGKTGVVTIVQSDISGLVAALAGKAASQHGHVIAEVTGLGAALDSKAATVHTHAISNVTGLQTALDGKASATHTHAISDVTGLLAALDTKAATASLGTAAALNVGTGASQVVQLDASAKLPAVDGSQLTNLVRQPGRILLATLNAANVPSISGLTVFDDTAYDDFELQLEDLLPSQSSSNWPRLRFASAGSVLTTPNYYSPVVAVFSNLSTSGVSGVSGVQNGGYLMYNVSSGWDGTSSVGMSGLIQFIGPRRTGVNKSALFQVSGYASGPYHWHSTGSCHFVGSTSALSGFQLFANAGNIVSGRIKVYGIVK